MGGGGDRLQAGAAEAVHGLTRDGRGKTGQEEGHAGNVAVVLAGLVAGAKDHVLDVVRVQRGPADQLADDVGGEVVWTDVPEESIVAADGSADGVDDNGNGHGPCGHAS